MQHIKLLCSYTHTFRTLISPNCRRLEFNACLRLLHFDSYYKTKSSDIVFSYNRTIDDHLKSGSLALAHKVFDEMSIRDVVSWNLLISGYKRHGNPTMAVNLYYQMVGQGVRESPSTFSTVLSICSNKGFYFLGVQVHCRVILFGLSENLYIDSSIVDLYMQMGFVDDGLKVFNQMPERSVAVWNVVLRGFCELGMWDEVVGAFSRVKCDGVLMNDLMLCYLLRGCCNGKFVSQGEQLHCYALKGGLVQSNHFVANALVDFYSACGSVDDVQRSFEVIPPENVISWNLIICAYADSGLLSDAIECFGRMQWSCVRPSVRSVVATLNSCSKRGNLHVGTQVHCSIVKLGFDVGNIYVQTALIDMYGKCYETERAIDAYECSDKTRECCNALLTSTLHCGLAEEVVELFKFMANEEGRFDQVSFSTVLKALPESSFGSLSRCNELHSFAIKSGILHHFAVSCSLIDFYSKLGQIDYARKVFEGLVSPNRFCFTSLINGYACNGSGRESLTLLELMIQKGLKPDRVTFLCVLTGCNHSGLVEEGRSVFNLMKLHHGIDPDRRHYACMVDLLGRAGLVYEAEELLRYSFVYDDSTMWSSLLRSCRTHKNKVVGCRVAKRLMELESGDPGACLQVSSFYFEIGDSELSMHYREMSTVREVVREIGHSHVV